MVYEQVSDEEDWEEGGDTGGESAMQVCDVLHVCVYQIVGSFRISNGNLCI